MVGYQPTEHVNEASLLRHTLKHVIWKMILLFMRRPRRSVTDVDVAKDDWLDQDPETTAKTTVDDDSAAANGTDKKPSARALAMVTELYVLWQSVVV